MQQQILDLCNRISNVTYENLTKSGVLSGLGGTVTLDDPRTEHSAAFTVVGVISDADAPYCDTTDYLEKRAYLMEEAIEPYWKRLRSWAMPEHMNKAYAEAAAQGIRETDVDLSFMRVIEGYEIFLRIDTYRSSEDLRREVRALNDAPAGSLRMRHRYLVGETTSGIAALTAPMEKISSLCGTIDRVTLAVSLAIMLLLTLLIVTERRYEIGILRCARAFAAADEIVLAAPYWDLSFPASVKTYFEHVTVTGVTFSYGADGRPIGHCRASRLFYVTTAGGPILPPHHGFAYVRDLATLFYGIPDVPLFSAEMLDVDGADVEGILRDAAARVDAYFL